MYVELCTNHTRTNTNKFRFYTYWRSSPFRNITQERSMHRHLPTHDSQFHLARLIWKVQLWNVARLNNICTASVSSILSRHIIRSGLPIWAELLGFERSSYPRCARQVVRVQVKSFFPMSERLTAVLQTSYISRCSSVTGASASILFNSSRSVFMLC
jgi:hypothetical protein